MRSEKNTELQPEEVFVSKTVDLAELLGIRRLRQVVRVEDLTGGADAPQHRRRPLNGLDAQPEGGDVR